MLLIFRVDITVTAAMRKRESDDPAVRPNFLQVSIIVKMIVPSYHIGIFGIVATSIIFLCDNTTSGTVLQHDSAASVHVGKGRAI